MTHWDIVFPNIPVACKVIKHGLKIIVVLYPTGISVTYVELQELETISFAAMSEKQL